MQVGKTQLRYHLRCIDDLQRMLVAHGDWIPLGNADEQRPAADGTVKAAKITPAVAEALSHISTSPRPDQRPTEFASPPRKAWGSG
jgi:hypothetical protein